MNQKVSKTLEFHKIISRLAECAVCDNAKEQARNLQPFLEKEQVEAAQQETTDAAEMLLRCATPPLYGVADISGILKRAEIGSVLRIRDILAVGRLLQTARLLKSYGADDRREEPTALSPYFRMLSSHKALEDAIFGSFLGEDEVADQASPALSSIRRKMRASAGKARELLEQMIRSSRIQKYLQDAIITMRDGRSVLPVKAEYRGEVQGVIHDTSASGSTLFIEPLAVVQENNRLRELEAQEAEEIERILADYTAQIGELCDPIAQNFHAIVTLDFLFAKGKLSLDMQGTRPLMASDIVLKKARHPLLPAEGVVPVDIVLEEGVDALIITGPNTGGKTVVLKTVGLFVLMHQAGLHLPVAEQSHIRFFQKVFADIGDEQSIEQSLSTFSAHMTNIVSIMEQVDDGSLVLFDELGAGTDPTEGAALAIAIMEQARAFGAQIAATTHYSELKLYALTTPGVQNASCEFDVETLRPTYRLLLGIPGKSNAFAISQKLGLSSGIIAAAKERLSEDNVRFEDVLSDLEGNRRKAREEAERTERIRRENELLRKTLRQEQDAIAQKNDKVLEKARNEAQEILLRAKREAEEILEEVKQLRHQARKKEVQKDVAAVKTKLNEKIDGLNRVKKQKQTGVRPQDIQPGRSVQVASVEQTGTVLTHPKDGKVIVQVGLMKMSVSLQELSLCEESPQKPQQIIRNRASDFQPKSFATELDLRGQVLDDAIVMTEKFLDDAILSGVHQVTIIHGKGTGVLRSGIHQLLKSHKRVGAFRLGSYGEGDSGVTVCELK